MTTPEVILDSSCGSSVALRGYGGTDSSVFKVADKCFLLAVGGIQNDKMVPIHKSDRSHVVL